MREGLDQWEFVILAYAVGLAAMVAMVVWSWMAMRRAETRREKTRERVSGK
jgi:heme exporter protein D